jgi:hypothetical protein
MFVSLCILHALRGLDALKKEQKKRTEKKSTACDARSRCSQARGRKQPITPSYVLLMCC